MKVAFATSLLARLKGLYAHKEYADVLVLMPCCDIHTFGMKKPVDVAFISPEGCVLKVVRGLEPNKRLKCSGAALVMERYSSLDSWPQEGMKIHFNWDYTGQLYKEGKEDE